MMRKFILTLYCSVTLTGLFGQLSFDSSAMILNLKNLSSDAMEGRKTGSEGGKKARTYIIGQLQKIGIKPFGSGYTQPFTAKEGVAGANILAVIPGKESETIVIGAHYDHLGIKNDAIFNGTDDNASGVAALLALAEYFKNHKPQHRLILAFFDAEEIGILGSAHFANTINLKKEQIFLFVNLDMVSRSDKNELYACGGFHYPDVKKRIEKVKTSGGIKLLFGHDDPALGNNDWTNQSDHYSFHLKKIPFIYFGVEDHPDYHRATDDFEKINRSFYANSVQTILACVRALDR